MYRNYNYKKGRNWETRDKNEPEEIELPAANRVFRDYWATALASGLGLGPPMAQRFQGCWRSWPLS